MVNFRFHLVSLVAVFLALALGIGMGATVIDKATVDSLKRRVTSVESERNNANIRGDSLQLQLNRANDYQTEVQPYLTSGKLNDVPVTVISVRGTDTDSLNGAKKAVSESGGKVLGTIWFTDKVQLTDSRAVTQLQNDLGSTSSDPAQLRQSLLALVSAVMAGASPPEALAGVVNHGFIDWEGGTAGNDITKAPLSTGRIIVASGAKPDVPNDQVAIPLTKLLAVQPTKRVVAIEAGRDSSGSTSAERAIFVDPLRNDASIKGRISTVDNIEQSPGLVATVLSLNQLASGRVGNYGVAESADSQIPPYVP